MNEFTGASWDKPDPSDPTSGMTLGQEVLNFRGFSTQYYMCAGGGGAPGNSQLEPLRRARSAAAAWKGPERGGAEPGRT